MTKKKVIKGLILFFVYVFIFVYLIKYVSENTDTINQIRTAAIPDVFIGIFCCFFCMVLTGLMDVTCAHVYGIKIEYGESIGLTFVASMINLILPLQLGSITKAVYLKKRLKLTYARYVSIISGTSVINLLITLVQIILCMIVVSFRMELRMTYILMFCMAFLFLIVCVIVSIWKQELIIRLLPFKSISTPIMKGFFELIGNKRAVIFAVVNLTISACIGGVRFYFIFKMLGFDGSMLDGFLYFGMYNASTVVPVLPGNIGISEYFVGVMNEILGSDFSIGVSAVLVNRIYYYIVAITGAVVAALPIWIRFNKIEKV